MCIIFHLCNHPSTKCTRVCLRNKEVLFPSCFHRVWCRPSVRKIDGRDPVRLIGCLRKIIGLSQPADLSAPGAISRIADALAGLRAEERSGESSPLMSRGHREAMFRTGNAALVSTPAGLPCRLLLNRGTWVWDYSLLSYYIIFST